MIFDYDWWHGDALPRQVTEARRRCTKSHFPDVDLDKAEPKSPAAKFLAGVEARIIIYLRDSAVYEVKEMLEIGRAGYLTFECVPADEAYRVGAFVVALPFDEIARVEVYAVHPKEKPEDSPLIKGFGGPGQRPLRPEERPPDRQHGA